MNPSSQGFAAGLIACSLLAALAGTTGCASTNGVSAARPDKPSSATPHADPLSPLRTLARQQTTHPDLVGADLVPDTLAQALTPIPPGTEAYATAIMPLAEIVEQLSPQRTPPPPPLPIDPDLRLQSLRHYVTGREHAVAGRTPQAIAEFERSLNIDQANPTLLRALGDAQATAGRRSAAVATLTRARSLGYDDPRVDIFLGREAIRARRFDEAVPLLASGQAGAARLGARPLAILAGVDLAQSLALLDHIDAARLVLLDAMRALEANPSDMARPEIAEVVRRRADLWFQIGDWSHRMGRHEDSLEAYDFARTLPGADASALALRQVVSLMTAGRSAQAALRALERLDETPLIIDGGAEAMLRLVARSEQVRPLLAPALQQTISRHADEGQSPSTLRRLAILSARAVGGTGGSDLILDAARRSPSDSELLRWAFAIVPGQAPEKLDLARRMFAQDPESSHEIASALIDQGSHVPEFVSLIRRRPGDTPALLRAAIFLRIGAYEEALAAIQTLPPESTPYSIRAKVAAECGQWQLARTAADEVLQDPRSSRFSRARALAAIQDFKQATSLYTHESAAPARELLSASTWALLSDDPASARTLLERARAADEANEQVYGALLGLHQTSGALPDPRAEAAVARQIMERAPGGRIFRQISAAEQLSRSRYSEVERQLISLADEWGDDDQLNNLFTVLWQRSAKSDPQIVARGEASVREALVHRPTAPSLVALLVEALVAQERIDEAEAFLKEVTTKLPLPELSAVQEALARDARKDPKRAAQLTVDRLTGRPLDIDRATDLISAHAALNDLPQAARVATDYLPRDITLTRAQSGRLMAIISRLDPEALLRAGPQRSDEALALVDALAQRGMPLPPHIDAARVLFLCAGHPSDTQRLITAIQEAAARHPALREQLGAQAVQVLLAREDATDGLNLLGALAFSGEEPVDSLVFEWFRLTFLRGDNGDIEHLVRTAPNPNHVLGVIANVLDAEVDMPDGDKQQRAELAYWLGNAASSTGREDLAEYAYRLTLEYEPAHAWTLNNLGYMILERHSNIDEAAAMIEGAYKVLSDDPSVIDSLGWLRYKQGIFQDQLNEDGQPITRGALSLLREAVTSDAKPDNPEQLDHMGDALWRTGDEQGARERWQRAARLLDTQIASQQRRPQEEPSAAVQKWTLDRQRISRKLAALAQGQRPPVAPTQAEFDQLAPAPPPN
jgi:tetratricopeptide (TPR) repeat protein